MITSSEFRSAILGVLGLPQVSGVLQLNSESKARALEAYVFALVVQTVRRAGGSADIRGVNTGVDPTPIVFRGAPGHMCSHQQDFCFASCELNGRTFEIHVGVIYRGRSGATHEIDVSICESRAAEKVRQFGVRFPAPSTLLRSV